MARLHSCLQPRSDVRYGPSTALALHGAATRSESLSDQNKLLWRCELSRLAPHPTGTACPMRSTTGIQEENDCGINYFWRRLSQIPPRSRTGWMVIPQTAQVYVYCIHRLETLREQRRRNVGPRSASIHFKFLAFFLRSLPSLVVFALLSGKHRASGAPPVSSRMRTCRLALLVMEPR